MATYTITINTKTNKTKYLLGLIKEIAKTEKKYINIFDEAQEDKALGSLMEEGLKSGKASRKEVFDALK